MLNSTQRMELLQGCQLNEYSPAFQRLVNRVVGTIYRDKTRSKKVSIRINYQISDVHCINRKKSAILAKKKRSVTLGKYYSTPKASRDCNIEDTRQIEKRAVCNIKISQKQVSSWKFYSLTRCITQPFNQTGKSFYRKISEYNKCLIAKKFHLQEYYLHNTNTITHIIDQTKYSASTHRTQSNASRIKKGQALKKQNNLLKCKNQMKLDCGKFKTAFVKKQEFQPWQTDIREEIYL